MITSNAVATTVTAGGIPPAAQPQTTVAETAAVAPLPQARIEEYLKQNKTSLPKIDCQEIRIYANYVEAESKGVKKIFSLIDFKNMLDRQLQVEFRLENIALPAGTFMFGKSNNEIQISIYYPERKMDLKYTPRYENPVEYKGCQMPNVIISHVLKLQQNEWVITQTHYMCTDKKINELPDNAIMHYPDRRKGVYSMPFPNFYEQGNMCYGQNVMPNRYKNNLRGLDYFYDIIAISPFNTDLGLRTSDADMNANIAKWFEYLQKLDKFDYTKATIGRYY